MEVIIMTVVKVATYARFISNNQREESIMSQQRHMHKYIAQKGYLLVE